MARIDDYAGRPGAIAAAARESGMRSVAGAPIIIDGDIWGAMVAASSDRQRLPDRFEDRLAEFTELVSAAIANAESRVGLARLAEEQAALRRVATLVARQASQIASSVASLKPRPLVGLPSTNDAKDAEPTNVAIASTPNATAWLAFVPVRTRSTAVSLSQPR